MFYWCTNFLSKHAPEQQEGSVGKGLDPDDVDYIDEEDSGSDSDGEGWVVSLPEHGITGLGAISDSEDEREWHGPIVNDNLDHSDGGKKRKAAGDTQSCEASDEEEGTEEFEAHEILAAAEEFWQKVFTKPINHLDVAPLKAKGSYTGTSPSSFYQKQSKLCKAAVGTAKLSNFFQGSTLVPCTSQPTIEVEQSDSTSFESDSVTCFDMEDQWVNPSEPPTPPHHQHDPMTQPLSCCQTLLHLTITHRV
ncbi:hypothetical protein EV702DRAFT_1040576 [Suillus placidus]|uniref:Uncharacterized protein n=1 Tax=Suillus placidus TaxID=48579 RepID=A0A9P7A813_9AGAM|nr:hypothetical protein EV702DRAFT_1040576 [Suillus placidus]